ncbi:hypothetical protein ACLX1H_006234 [Fusarium chlamydosporum]
MPGSIKSIKRKPTAKSAAKRIGRMFKRTNSEDPEMITGMDTSSPKVSFDVPRASTSSRFSISSRMTSRDDTEGTPRGSKDQSRLFASWFDPATPKKEKESEAMAPPPLVSAYSEPVLEHAKPLEPMKPAESTNPPQPEAFPFPVVSQTREEPKITGGCLDKQTEPPREPENIDKKAQKQHTLEHIAQLKTRPLPYPPGVGAAAYEPESPILPTLPKEMLKEKPNPTPADESKAVPKPTFSPERNVLAQPKLPEVPNSRAEPAKHQDIHLPKTEDAPKPPNLPVQVPKPIDAPSKKSAVPRPTVENEPEPVVNPVEAPREQPRTKTKSEAKTEPKHLVREAKPKVQPAAMPEKNVPIVPEAIRRRQGMKTSSKASTASIIPLASRTFSIPAPAPSSVPKAATYTAKHSFTPCISFQPSRTVYFPDTAPAPKTARAPITVPAPIIASTPEVVVSMLTQTAPKPVPAPQRAHAPSTSWIISSA